MIVASVSARFAVVRNAVRSLWATTGPMQMKLRAKIVVGKKITIGGAQELVKFLRRLI
jgi:hypothetical protein